MKVTIPGIDSFDILTDDKVGNDLYAVNSMHKNDGKVRYFHGSSSSKSLKHTLLYSFGWLDTKCVDVVKYVRVKYSIINIKKQIELFSDEITCAQENFSPENLIKWINQRIQREAVVQCFHCGKTRKCLT